MIGFFGSLHCIGMCGPINLFMIGKSQSTTSFWIYHFGRIVTYVFIGVLLGLIGYSASIFNGQQFITFALGIALLMLYGIPGFRNRIERIYYQSPFFSFIKKRLADHVSAKQRWLVAGILNGFLPCGLTYVAAAGAVVSGNLIDGMVFMMLFGIGTMPALILISLSGALSSTKLKKLIPNTISFVAIISGSLLILRGLLIASPNFNQLVQNQVAGLITVCGL